MKVHKPVDTHFTAAFEFNNNLLQNQYQEYSSHISCEIAKWSKKMGVQMKTALFNPSDAISVLSFLDSFRTA